MILLKRTAPPCSSFMILLMFISACTQEVHPNDEPPELELIAQYPLEFPGPSGLALDPGGEYLWSVSDTPGGSIYRITFTGEILEEIEVDSEDMEGITVDSENGSLWVVEERSREIVNFTRDGVVLRREELDIERRGDNDGLEGITINPNTGHFYVVNEKNPRLFIELNSALEIINIVPVDFSGEFAVSDISGIAYNAEEDMLWIVSDEAAKIVVTDFQANPKRVYPTQVNDGEGIAVDPENGLVYIVSDGEQMLYVFRYD